MELSKQIAQTRLAQGYTQASLAAMLGVSKSMVEKLERGARKPSLTLLSRLQKILNVSFEIE